MFLWSLSFDFLLLHFSALSSLFIFQRMPAKQQLRAIMLHDIYTWELRSVITVASCAAMCSCTEHSVLHLLLLLLNLQTKVLSALPHLKKKGTGIQTHNLLTANLFLPTTWLVFIAKLWLPLNVVELYSSRCLFSALCRHLSYTQGQVQ